MVAVIEQLGIQDAPDGPGELGREDDGKTLRWDAAQGRFVAVEPAANPTQVYVTGGRSGQSGTSTIAGATDFAGTPSEDTDGYAIVWDNAAGAFTLATFEEAGAAAAAIAAHVAESDPHEQYLLEADYSAPITDHGALSGLDDNDHPQYLLAAGVSAYGATLIDDDDAAAARTTLGLGTMATATEDDYLLADGSRAGATGQAQAFANPIIVADGSAGAPALAFTVPTTGFFRESSVAIGVAIAGAKYFLFDRSSNARNPRQVITNLAENQYSSSGFILRNVEANDSTGQTEWHLFAQKDDVGVGTGTSSLQIRKRNDSQSAAVTFIQVLGNNNLILQAGYTAGGQTQGYVAVGHLAPTALLDLGSSTTERSSLRIRSGTTPASPNDGDIWNNGNSLALRINGTNAVNTDGGLSIWMQSSTTARNVGRLLWRYTDKTDATRATQGSVTAYYTSTEHTPVTWGANSSGALLSFYDVTTPIARQTLATGAGATVDQVITALQNLGLLKQS